MEINIEELKDWQDCARSGLRDEIDCLEEKSRQINSYMRLLDAMEEIVSEADNLKETVEKKQREIDDLSEQLEQRDQEIDDLRRQLLEAQNQQLESEKQHLVSEKQHLEAEVSAKPMEIHNHFEPGRSAQVFNEKVTGKFTKNKDKKEKKKRWKKMARRIL